MGRNYSHWRSASTLSLALLLLAFATLSSGCRHTLNSTGIQIPPGWDHPDPGGGGNNGTPVSITNFTVTRPGGGDIHAGDQLTVTLSFTGDIDPYAIGYIFNDNCVDP